MIQLTAEERAAQKAEELKKRIEQGELENEMDKKEKAEIGTKSRFDLLDEECPWINKINIFFLKKLGTIYISFI